MSNDQQKSPLPYAIVISLDSINGIQTARILADHDIPVIAIAKDPDHHCCRTKVCERILFTDTESEELIDTLEGLAPTLDREAVLVPCEDMGVLLITKYRQRLEAWYKIVLPKYEVIETLMNKVSFYSYAQENGFPIAPTRFLNSRADAVRAAQELAFPCVVKPPISATPEWEENNDEKAYKVSSPEELLAVYDRTSGLVKDLIVQSWIEGPDSNLYSCNCYLDEHSEPLVTFVARKLRQWPPQAGDSCLGEECRDDVVLREALRLLKSAGHQGLGYVEIKKDSRTGEYFMIEPNLGRPTGRSAISEAGGVALLYTMYCHAVGLPLPENRQQNYGHAKWISLRKDFQSALYHWREGNLTLKGWWRSIRGKKAYALFSWSDPGPFIGDLQRVVRLYFMSAEHRQRGRRKAKPGLGSEISLANKSKEVVP